MGARHPIKHHLIQRAPGQASQPPSWMEDDDQPDLAAIETKIKVSEESNNVKQNQNTIPVWSKFENPGTLIPVWSTTGNSVKTLDNGYLTGVRLKTRDGNDDAKEI